MCILYTTLQIRRKWGGEGERDIAPNRGQLGAMSMSTISENLLYLFYTQWYYVQNNLSGTTFECPIYIMLITTSVQCWKAVVWILCTTSCLLQWGPKRALGTTANQSDVTFHYKTCCNWWKLKSDCLLWIPDLKTSSFVFWASLIRKPRAHSVAG